jgi:Flp pilus assembly protein TadD
MMTKTHRVQLGRPLLAAALAALLLSGCSAGMSSYGSNTLKVAEISNIGDYTAEGALAKARGHFRNNDFGHSAALYERAVELAPKNPEGYVGLSASYDRLGRFDLSDRVYASLFKITGGTAQYYNNVGYSYMLRGSLSEAVTALRKAAAIDPKNEVVRNNLLILQKAAQRT